MSNVEQKVLFTNIGIPYLVAFRGIKAGKVAVGRHQGPINVGGPDVDVLLAENSDIQIDRKSIAWFINCQFSPKHLKRSLNHVSFKLTKLRIEPD